MTAKKPKKPPAPPKPYYTPYPYHLAPTWHWFDVAVFHEFSPHLGNLPSAVFAKLKGGKPGLEAKADRVYGSEAEALEDYRRATAEPPPASGDCPGQ